MLGSNTGTNAGHPKRDDIPWSALEGGKLTRDAKAPPMHRQRMCPASDKAAACRVQLGITAEQHRIDGRGNLSVPLAGDFLTLHRDRPSACGHQENVRNNEG